MRKQSPAAHRSTAAPRPSPHHSGITSLLCASHTPHQSVWRHTTHHRMRDAANQLHLSMVTTNPYTLHISSPYMVNAHHCVEWQWLSTTSMPSSVLHISISPTQLHCACCASHHTITQTHYHTHTLSLSHTVSHTLSQATFTLIHTQSCAITHYQTLSHTPT